MKIAEIIEHLESVKKHLILSRNLLILLTETDEYASNKTPLENIDSLLKDGLGQIVPLLDELED